jgi:alanyl-tRNA synthetase
LSYVKAKRTVTKRFEEFGFPLIEDRNVLPKDESTLFVCSGMQNLKDRFYSPDGGRYGSRQSCIRTNDLDLVGDGTHLTYFEMLGNFSFGGNDYQVSVDLWHSIISDLNLPVTHITVHPQRPDHSDLWKKHGYGIVLDENNIWSDGEIGGHCCEVFCGNLEIGNLVNPLGHSTDVGFGWERLHMVVEQKNVVHETSLFDTSQHPVVSDHLRSLQCLIENGVIPSNKGRGYVMRRLIRRILPLLDEGQLFCQELVDKERESREKTLRSAKKSVRKNKDKSPQWWWDTFGVLPDELPLLGL